MRLLSFFLGVSGLVGIGGSLALNALDGGTQWWPVAHATSASPVVVVGTLVAFFARTSAQVVHRLAALWLVAVAAGFVSVATSFGYSVDAAGAALLFVTMGFAAWLVFPLLALSYVRDRRPPHSASVTVLD